MSDVRDAGKKPTRWTAGAETAVNAVARYPHSAIVHASHPMLRLRMNQLAMSRLRHSHDAE
ncbi:MAG TPA: hypothetical protein VFM56_05500, partial [Solimonas sp.]|nr:hypothetical protein [Solimonas sp.]